MDVCCSGIGGTGLLVAISSGECRMPSDLLKCRALNSLTELCCGLDHAGQVVKNCPLCRERTEGHNSPESLVKRFSKDCDP